MLSFSFLRHFWYQVRRGDLQLVASGLSYATVLSLIPFLAVCLAVLQRIDALDFVYPQVETLILSYLKGPAGKEGLILIKKAIVSVQKGRIGIVSSIGLLITSSLLLHKIEVGIHRVWHIHNKRPLYRRLFSHWLILICFPFLLAVFVSLTTTKILVSIFPLAVWHLTALFFGLALIYKFVPSVKVKWWTCFLSSAVATASLVFLFSSLKVLTRVVLSYNKFYGSLAAIPVFLIFVLLFWYVVLMGTAISVGLNGKSRKLAP